MDLRALIARMDKIESRQILNEAITMKDIQAAVGQEKDEQKRAGILNDLAWKENLPGLYDPVSGYFVRKQSMPSGDRGQNNYDISATAPREADTQALAKLGLVPGTAKTSALGGLIGTGKNSWLGLDKEQDAANNMASSAVKQQSANVQGKQSSDAFVAPKLKRLTDLVAKISGGTMESFSFNGSISRKLVESFSYELYEKATLGTGPVDQKDIGNGMTISTGRYQSEVAEIKSLMAELADIDDPAVIQALGSAQKALDKLAGPSSPNQPNIMKPLPSNSKPGQKVDPTQADRDDAEMGKAMSANARAAREKEYGDNTDRADAEQGAAMRANAQAAREKEYGDNVDRTDAELGKAMAANAAGGTTKPGGQSASPTAGKVGAGKVGPANPGTKAIQHYLNTKHGQKLDLDGKDGPLTTAAIRSLSGKISTDEYANIAGLAYAYNVKPGQGPGTVSLGNPEFVKRMTALGYDPKTGNPVGGAKPTAGAGQSAGSRVNTTNTAELENSIKAIEAILAKNRIKSESIHPDDALVLENISNFTLQEQMEIWSLLVEAGPRTAAQQASMQTAATGINPPNNPFGLTPDRAAPTSNTGKLAKFTSKLGGASGIGRKIAARAGASALAGPAALIVGAGMAAWTAYEVGKALYDTFKDDELPSMDPADQELIKKHMSVILQYQKNTDMMAQLPPELKTRLEGALKGLDKIAARADTDIPSSAGANVGAAAAKVKQVAGSAVDSTVDAGNKFAAGVKQGYNQQAASPAASAPTSTSGTNTNTSTRTQSKQSVDGTLRMGKPDGPITFNGKVVNPGDPAYPEAAAALIKAQGDARDRSRTRPSSGPISAGAPNVDRSTFEDVKSEDDEILKRIRSAFRF